MRFFRQPWPKLWTARRSEAFNSFNPFNPFNFGCACAALCPFVALPFHPSSCRQFSCQIFRCGFPLCVSPLSLRALCFKSFYRPLLFLRCFVVKFLIFLPSISVPSIFLLSIFSVLLPANLLETCENCVSTDLTHLTYLSYLTLCPYLVTSGSFLLMMTNVPIHAPPGMMKAKMNGPSAAPGTMKRAMTPNVTIAAQTASKPIQRAFGYLCRKWRHK